ncbi:MAG TPA: PDZ domain-containing protein, partial [Longimicrobiales bacterium]
MRPTRLVAPLALAAVIALGAAPLAAQRTPEPKRGWLGFAYGGANADMVPAADGSQVIHVHEVLKGSPADKAGMEPGDIIVRDFRYALPP